MNGEVMQLVVTLVRMSLEDLAQAHAALDRAVRTLYADRARLIQQARADGHTWQAIADTLGMTVHGAIKASRMDRE